MLELAEVQHKIRGCQRCQFNENTDVRYCGGSGVDFRVMFVAESPSTAGGTGIREPELNFSKTPRDELFLNARKRVGMRDSYITDLVKCGIVNGKPSLEKLDNCFPYLQEEIRLVRPRVIVAVGKTISFQDGKKRVTYNFLELLQKRIGNAIPTTWVYHYSWVYRYHRDHNEMTRRFHKQFDDILKFL
jgi:uracil-DNA glycosylase family 4